LPVSDDKDVELHERAAPVSGGGPSVARLRPRGRVPPILSVALVAGAVGLLVGVGLGYRFGAAVVATAAPDSLGARVQRAFEATVPADWAVCEVGDAVLCHELEATMANPAVPPSEYGLGWYGWRSMTSVTLKPGKLVVAGRLGHGSAVAWLDRMGPGDTFLETIRLTPATVETQGTLYLDLGTLPPGHYVVETDYMAVNPSRPLSLALTYVVGFVVV
jgi:hypothetical protein